MTPQSIPGLIVPPVLIGDIARGIRDLTAPPARVRRLAPGVVVPAGEAIREAA